MTVIQLDMFEVQLGAAVLLTFNDPEGTVRVLADGGVGKGVDAGHVLKKLDPILGSTDRRIDLIIGTHYDEDHLKGLVPVIDDTTIDIGEAWLPPVVNDVRRVAVDKRVTASDLLAHQFAADGGSSVLDEYLAAKQADVEMLLELESKISDGNADKYLTVKMHAEGMYGDDPIGFFRAQLAGDDDCASDHGVDDDISDPNVKALLEGVAQGYYPSDGFWEPGDTGYVLRRAIELKSDAPAIAMAQARTLANIRKSTAKKAINAKALNDVVQALGRRKLKPRTEIIDDGVPKAYRWIAADRRFVLAKSAGSGLAFTLLGPSRSLVQKHLALLPVSETSKVALAFRGEIRGITPSNQLSYIGCFSFAEQRILVAGDAGCVDFSNGRNSYYPALTDAMKPLHVIQVAHHGGDNAHFYRVLAAANYPEQTEKSWLLLSHAYHDPTRPSDVFHDFLLATLGVGDDVRLLFTSEPTRDKVADFIGAIHPRVGPGGKVGDVRMTFSDGEWRVDLHAIEVV